jgi:zinc transporter ZupT
MPIFLGIVAASLVPVAIGYFVPPPSQPESTNDKLFRWSLIGGIIVTALTIYSYMKGK